MNRLYCTAAALVISTTVVSFAQEPDMSLQTLREMRRELAFRKRGIIANNDGCDCLYFPRDKELTPEAFLDQRTTQLAGTQVGAISYCSISSGFSHFTHNTKVGTILTRQSADYGIAPTKRNVTQELIDMGADCLTLVVDYAKKNDMEAFWSFRMNDTHDVAHTPEKPYLLYPKLKEEHPDWLVGNHRDRTPHGRWSSMNYAVPQVRDLAFRFIEEVCSTYDVDGVELDYFRHMCYFPSVANGGKASQEEADMITGLMRRVRIRTEELGRTRRRPFLIAVRVADSVGFNRDMGLDVEQWLKEGLVDILITTGYFRLNPWTTSVELGHRYGVAVYPCLSDSRIRGGTRFHRGSTQAYRARAANVWLAGADGVYTYNFFNPTRPTWSEIGSPETLAGLDKLYFVTIRDGNPGSWLKNGGDHASLPMLSPSSPLGLKPGQPRSVEMVIGEDIAAGLKTGKTPTVSCHAELVNVVTPDHVTLSMNGTPLVGEKADGDWFDFAVPADLLVQGQNRFSFSARERPAVEDSESQWSVSYVGTEKPGGKWKPDPGSAQVIEEVMPDGYLIADRGTVSGDYRYYRAGWGLTADGKGVIEARVKVIDGISSVIFGTGTTGERLRLTPSEIYLHHNRGVSYEMDTASEFHVYRIETDGSEVKVFVDGELRLSCPTAMAPRRYRCEVAFGAASSGELGEAVWSYVRARASSVSIRDLAVTVTWR